MLIRLLYHESKITLLTLFFDKIQQKSRHLSRFFFLNFPRYRPFFAYFLQNKNFTHFFPKIPYYRDLRFWKSWKQNFSFFLNTVFRRFPNFFAWYYRGVLTQKNAGYMYWYPFFCDILFFVKKCFRGDHRPKKKRISLLKSRISLNSWTSVPIYGIKRGYYRDSDVFLADSVLLPDILDFFADILTFFHDGW